MHDRQHLQEIVSKGHHASIKSSMPTSCNKGDIAYGLRGGGHENLGGVWVPSADGSEST